MTVSDLLRSKPTKVFTVLAHEGLGRAAQLLLQHQIGGLPVVDESGALLGFLSERDIIRALERRPEALRKLAVSEAMRQPAPVCRSDDRLQGVMSRMTRDRLRHLVVMGDEGILGVISVGDLVKHRLEQLETETAVLRDYVAGQRAQG